MYTPDEMRKLLKPQREQVTKPQHRTTATTTDYVQWFRDFSDETTDDLTDDEVLTVVSRCSDEPTNMAMVEAAVTMAKDVMVGRGAKEKVRKVDPQHPDYGPIYTRPPNFGNTDPHEA